MDSSTRSQFTILVVEDEWLLRMHLTDELAAAGWQTLEAGTGEEAMALVAADPGIHLLITDIRLPGRADGWDVAESFRAAHPGRPVLYISANPDLSGRRVPGSIFLSKPCDMAAVLALCDKLALDL